MRNFIYSFIGCLLAITAAAQSTGNLPAIDKSPMDMSYYPVNHPVLKIQDKSTEPLAARVIYSRPQKNGRTVFGELVQYGKVWRLGANEATEIEFYRTVKIGNKKIQKGRYTLYALVNENSWTIIVNKDTDTWGAFKYDIKHDVVRMDVPVQDTDQLMESLTLYFEKSARGANLVMAWDRVKVVLPLIF